MGLLAEAMCYSLERSRSMDKLRLVQVGLGFWGLDWAEEVLPQAQTVETVAHVDPDLTARAALAARIGVPPQRCFARLAEALNQVPCDAVLASLPTAFHAAIANEALEAGKHVIVEKPFTPTLAEAVQLVRLAEERGLVLMVSQNYRFYPAAIAAADLIASGSLGQPLAATIDFRRHAPSEAYRYYGIPDPLLADMAIHHFDLLRMVLGLEPVETSCRTWNPPGSPFAADPCGAATILFTGGVVASWRGSWLSRAPATAWGGEWMIDCEEGAVFLACRGSKGARLAAERLAVCRPGGGIEPQPLVMFEEHDRAGAIAAFAQAVLTGTEPPRFSSGRDNLGSLVLIEACRLSAARGGTPVRLADILPEP
jgi:predicted dehydrogenase